MGRQQQPEDVGVVDLGPGEYINEMLFENDKINFFFFFSPGMVDHYHENMARQYFFPFSFFFSFSKLIECLGLFFNLFDISYQPVADDRLV